MSKLFYKPEDGWLADVIPFYEDGEFKLLYLKDWRDREGHGEGTPWFLLGTRDFIHYKEYGEVLPRGGVSEQDLYIYTGCVLKKTDCIIFSIPATIFIIRRRVRRSRQ